MFIKRVYVCTPLVPPESFTGGIYTCEFKYRHGKQKYNTKGGDDNNCREVQHMAGGVRLIGGAA